MDLAVEAAAALDRLRHHEGWVLASAPEERFGSLFGRDALVAALQLLPRDPSVAHATLARLGAELGRHHDPATEEEPGKVLHEARDHGLEPYEAHGWPIRDGRLRYYGSVDAGPWFLVLAAALARSGEDVRAHLPAARRVAGWIAAQPAPLAYDPAGRAAGLAHQGWRDVTWDRQGGGHGVVGEDGAPLGPPVAMAAVGALAWRALEEAAAVLGIDTAAAAARARAAWRATFAAAPAAPPAFARHVGGTDRSATSDLGHVLWTGILGHDDPRAAAACHRLLAPDLSTPFGLRTLAVGHAAFSPAGYHTGAVWPWDCWVGAAGLDAVEPGAGEAVRAGMLEAVTRLSSAARRPVFPELYAVGTDGALASSAESCQVQAWTAGAVLAVDAGWDGRAWAGA